MNTQINAEQIFSINSHKNFEDLALQIFRYQAENCPVYQSFIAYLGLSVAGINAVKQIPYLPISFFKTQRVITGNAQPEITFSSSGTTGNQTSRHLMSDVSLYKKSFQKGFEIFYGPIRNYAILALLPSYSEREGSSLIYMVDDWIANSPYPQSGYFLYNHTDLYQTLLDLQQQQIPTILIGVTYALLDFVENFRIHFPELIVMETGGMKGRRKEIIRQELHQKLCHGFGVSSIHSEYGMTELLSQAYARSEGIYICPSWMQIHIRDINDPLSLVENGKTGGINIIDLANLYSCSFIATQDLGRKISNESFEILGRFDNSDIRGCNLLI